MLGVEAEIDIAQIPEGAREQRSACEEQQGERDLARDEDFAEADVGYAG